MVSCEWLSKLLNNSSATELIHRVDEKFNRLAAKEKGGITRLKIQLDEMFCITNDVVKALQDFLTRVAQDGPTKIPGENIAELTAQINAVCERLSEEGRLPQETPIHVLEGLTKCSVPEFKGPFQLLLDSAWVNEMSTASSSLVTCADTLKKVKEITAMADNSFHSLNTSTKWNVPGGSTLANRVVVCFNCGGNHYLHECPKPKNQELIKKNKDAWLAERKAAGKSNSGGGGGGKANGSRQSNRKKWGNDNKSKGNGAGSNGLVKVGNEWFCQCKHCDGLNQSHTTKYHTMWQKNPGAFALPDTHPFVKKTKGKINNGTHGGTTAAVPPGVATMLTEQKSQLASLIKSTQENAADPDLSSFLAGFAKVLGLN